MRTAIVVLLAWLAIATLMPTPVANAETLEGQVVNPAGVPIGGLTVYLVHPQVGRSAPVTTGADGWFKFSRVPLLNQPYYIEIYWGPNPDDLVYRDLQWVRGDVSLPNPITIK